MSGWRTDYLKCLIRSGLESIKFCTPDMTMRIQHRGAPHVLHFLETSPAKSYGQDCHKTDKPCDQGLGCLKSGLRKFDPDLALQR
jgi:hypothetical protein